MPEVTELFNFKSINCSPNTYPTQTDTIFQSRAIKLTSFSFHIDCGINYLEWVYTKIVFGRRSSESLKYLHGDFKLIISTYQYYFPSCNLHGMKKLYKVTVKCTNVHQAHFIIYVYKLNVIPWIKCMCMSVSFITLLVFL